MMIVDKPPNPSKGSSMLRTKLASLLLVSLLALFGAACGGDDDPAGGGGTESSETGAESEDALPSGDASETSS